MPSPPPSARDRAGTAPTYPGGYWRASGDTRGRGGATVGGSSTTAATREEDCAASGGMESVAAMKGLGLGRAARGWRVIW